MDTGKPAEKTTSKRYRSLCFRHMLLPATLKKGRSFFITLDKTVLFFSFFFFCSVLGKKKTFEGHILPGNILRKEKGSVAEGAGSLLVASPPDQETSSDLDLDSKPKKGIIFEICSEDGFHIRCESIEGEGSLY